ncbi:gamma-secretase-activating protein [Anaeramoeba flamelloides]|uniref:Gamma-secretase-activating protein n=1 Tax=Anaeramoeba flamelloides TaxID=1746091 RepID=A0ABQ8XA79_9EUKA|nr:gamma-secretase-activating protein [Anaeramoeba flamelloides]
MLRCHKKFSFKNPKITTNFKSTIIGQEKGGRYLVKREHTDQTVIELFNIKTSEYRQLYVHKSLIRIQSATLSPTETFLILTYQDSEKITTKRRGSMYESEITKTKPVYFSFVVHLDKNQTVVDIQKTIKQHHRYHFLYDIKPTKKEKILRIFDKTIIAVDQIKIAKKLLKKKKKPKTHNLFKIASKFIWYEFRCDSNRLYYLLVQNNLELKLVCKQYQNTKFITIYETIIPLTNKIKIPDKYFENLRYQFSYYYKTPDLHYNYQIINIRRKVQFLCNYQVVYKNNQIIFQIYVWNIQLQERLQFNVNLYNYPKLFVKKGIVFFGSYKGLLMIVIPGIFFTVLDSNLHHKTCDCFISRSKELVPNFPGQDPMSDNQNFEQLIILNYSPIIYNNNSFISVKEMKCYSVEFNTNAILNLFSDPKAKIDDLTNFIHIMILHFQEKFVKECIIESLCKHNLKMFQPKFFREYFVSSVWQRLKEIPEFSSKLLNYIDSTTRRSYGLMNGKDDNMNATNYLCYKNKNNNKESQTIAHNNLTSITREEKKKLKKVTRYKKKSFYLLNHHNKKLSQSDQNIKIKKTPKSKTTSSNNLSIRKDLKKNNSHYSEQTQRHVITNSTLESKLLKERTTFTETDPNFSSRSSSLSGSGSGSGSVSGSGSGSGSGSVSDSGSGSGSSSRSNSDSNSDSDSYLDLDSNKNPNVNINKKIKKETVQNINKGESENEYNTLISLKKNINGDTNNNNHNNHNNNNNNNKNYNNHYNNINNNNNHYNPNQNNKSMNSNNLQKEVNTSNEKSINGAQSEQWGCYSKEVLINRIAKKFQKFKIINSQKKKKKIQDCKNYATIYLDLHLEQIEDFFNLILKNVFEKKLLKDNVKINLSSLNNFIPKINYLKKIKKNSLNEWEVKYSFIKNIILQKLELFPIKKWVNTNYLESQNNKKGDENVNSIDEKEKGIQKKYDNNTGDEITIKELYEIFKFMENLYSIIEERDLPFPTNFHYHFIRLGYKVLPRPIFLQYLDLNIFKVDQDFINTIQNNYGNNNNRSFVHYLISLLENRKQINQFFLQSRNCYRETVEYFASILYRIFIHKNSSRKKIKWYDFSNLYFSCLTYCFDQLEDHKNSQYENEIDFVQTFILLYLPIINVFEI